MKRMDLLAALAVLGKFPDPLARPRAITDDNRLHLDRLNPRNETDKPVLIARLNAAELKRQRKNAKRMALSK